MKSNPNNAILREQLFKVHSNNDEDLENRRNYIRGKMGFVKKQNWSY